MNNLIPAGENVEKELLKIINRYYVAQQFNISHLEQKFGSDLLRKNRRESEVQYFLSSINYKDGPYVKSIVEEDEATIEDMVQNSSKDIKGKFLVDYKKAFNLLKFNEKENFQMMKDTSSGISDKETIRDARFIELYGESQSLLQAYIKDNGIEAVESLQPEVVISQKDFIKDCISGNQSDKVAMREGLVETLKAYEACGVIEKVMQVESDQSMDLYRNMINAPAFLVGRARENMLNEIKDNIDVTTSELKEVQSDKKECYDTLYNQVYNYKNLVRSEDSTENYAKGEDVSYVISDLKDSMAEATISSSSVEESSLVVDELADDQMSDYNEEMERLKAWEDYMNKVATHQEVTGNLDASINMQEG